MFRDLRYIRIPVENLDRMRSFTTEYFGLQISESTDDTLWLRSDERNYSLCLTTQPQNPCIAFTVARPDDLTDIAERLNRAGFSSEMLSEEAATVRQSKMVLATTAPNGVSVEIVWRPLTSGWRYHAHRDAGITGLAAVQLGATDLAVNERFWVDGIGLQITDWIGDAAMLTLDDCHHQVALYPSKRDGLIGVAWHVESKDQIMQNWYAAQAAQIPVVAGPDRQAASSAMYISVCSPEGLVMSYFSEMDAGPHIKERGPRQFSDSRKSHGIWGSEPLLPEFRGQEDD